MVSYAHQVNLARQAEELTMDKEKILKEARQEGMLGVDEGTKHA